MLVSDVVLMGRIRDLSDGISGTMNASLSVMATYKGPDIFLDDLDNVTNFEKDSSKEVSLFFLTEEPAGNLALQCITPLGKLHVMGDLTSLLDFVSDVGKGEWDAMCMICLKVHARQRRGAFQSYICFARFVRRAYVALARADLATRR